MGYVLHFGTFYITFYIFSYFERVLSSAVIKSEALNPIELNGGKLFLIIQAP